MRDKAYLRDVRKRKIQRKNVLVKQFMAWIGIHMMDSIQREKFIVDVDCVSLVKSMDCQPLEICEKNQENIFCMMIIKRRNKKN